MLTATVELVHEKRHRANQRITVLVPDGLTGTNLMLAIGEAIAGHGLAGWWYFQILHLQESPTP